MTAMIVELLLLAASTATSPEGSRSGPASYAGARAEGRVAVQILAGARVAAGEAQDSALPPVQDSSVRAANGSISPARLVEFE